jgi:hypothetical protein
MPRRDDEFVGRYCYRDRMPPTPLLTRLLEPPDRDSASDLDVRLRRALAADPALAGRVRWQGTGFVLLTGPVGAPPPTSLKERRRWELHVRLRLVAELGESEADPIALSWVDEAGA